MSRPSAKESASMSRTRGWWQGAVRAWTIGALLTAASMGRGDPGLRDGG